MKIALKKIAYYYSLRFLFNSLHIPTLKVTSRAHLTSPTSSLHPLNNSSHSLFLYLLAFLYSSSLLVISFLYLGIYHLLHSPLVRSPQRSPLPNLWVFSLPILSMAPKAANPEGADPTSKFIFSVLKHCEQIKPDWDKVASENGIGYPRNAWVDLNFWNSSLRYGIRGRLTTD